MRITLQHPLYHDTDGAPIQFQRNRDRFYFEIQADGNYETITTSEVYESKIDAVSAIALFTDAGLKFEFVDKTV